MTAFRNHFNHESKHKLCTTGKAGPFLGGPPLCPPPATQASQTTAPGPSWIVACPLRLVLSEAPALGPLLTGRRSWINKGRGEMSPDDNQGPSLLLWQEAHHCSAERNVEETDCSPPHTDTDKMCGQRNECCSSHASTEQPESPTPTLFLLELSVHKCDNS